MNPRGAVLGLAVAMSICLSAAAFLITPIAAGALTFAGGISALLLNHSYAKALGHEGRPLARVPFDHWVGGEAMIAFLVPLLVMLLVVVRIAPGAQASIFITVVVFALATVFEVCFVSSLVDWYYVLPRRDGIVGCPPCRSPADEKWQGVTWFWFLHRFAAAITVMVGAYVVALCLGFWLVDRYPKALAAAGGIPVLLFVISYFRREYLRDIGKVWSLLFSPAVALGEHISARRDGQASSGFVFNLSIDRLDLLNRKDVMSHVLIGNVVAHAKRSNKKALCSDECVRGHADETGRAPIGGHGGCLADTPSERREPRRARRRVLVF